MRPDVHPHFAPGQIDVRMMALLLGNRAGPVDELPGFSWRIFQPRFETGHGFPYCQTKARDENLERGEEFRE